MFSALSGARPYRTVPAPPYPFATTREEEKRKSLKKSANASATSVKKNFESNIHELSPIGFSTLTSTRSNRRQLYCVKNTKNWFCIWVQYVFLLAPSHASHHLSHPNWQRVEDFFSKDVTHLIVMNFDESLVNKENHKTRASQSGASVLYSPIKQKK
jgi:hypothetical protein